MRGFPRAAMAAGFAALALAIPLAAWYRVGSREAEREAARIEGEPARVLGETGDRLRQSLGRRLDELLQVESRRPFYHYQNLYHDPRGVSQGAAVAPSPLSEGPTDPLVEAHFQVRADGSLTLPTLNEEGLKTGVEVDVAAQQAVRDRLRPAVSEALRVAGEQEGPWTNETLTAPTGAQPASSPQQAVKLERLRPEAWSQNAQVNQIYSQMQGQKPPPKLSTRGREIVVRVGPMRWRTVPVSGGPALSALRTVVTPDGTLVQGFLVSASEIGRTLSASAFPAHFAPGPPSGKEEFLVALGGAAWHLRLDAAATQDAARRQAREARSEFQKLFAAGATAALAAALALLALLWQSERLARRRSRLAASAAHELRTPLAGLRLYAEMLAEGQGDPSRFSEYARRVAAETARLGRVVSNLLTFSRLERRRLSVRPEPGDLAAAVRDAVDRQRPALEAAGVRLETAIPDSLPGVVFDSDAVTEILQNLLDNAEKYSRSRAGRRIRVAVRGGQSGAEVSVADDGPGIPAELRRRLFRPFSRGDTERSPVGLGLGLTLARALARAQGGDVSAGDAPGGGALFTVSFPVFAEL